MDLTENVLLHETSFIRPSTIALNLVVARYRDKFFTVNKRNTLGLCKIPSYSQIQHMLCKR